MLLQLAEDHDGCEVTASTTQSSDRNITGIHSIVNITRYSSLNQLAAVTAYVLRYIHNSCKQQPLLNGPLTAVELTSARKLCISSSQSTDYPAELGYTEETGFMSQTTLFVLGSRQLDQMRWKDPQCSFGPVY